MKTEDYVIIVVCVTVEQNKVEITYANNTPEPGISIKVIDSDRKPVKSFDHLAQADKGIVSFDAAGLPPGTYHCDITLDNEVKDSRSFAIG
ncbi:hypothetical protein [Taibaiella chishuiensis]|uniref:Uncharacterized protein n=1 Tax=Taibaiella chishuiensis TaxID=1434707 RepID=A0A2P8CT61_9BACT|nr:hypothetical protein [Taibaiella chishuiensis]PSK88153.1 hypothetical protein B0I18_11547 [Taibaiella chishuiensis]